MSDPFIFILNSSFIQRFCPKMYQLHARFFLLIEIKKREGAGSFSKLLIPTPLNTNSVGIAQKTRFPTNYRL